jgi:anti-sigma B factor antagonist
VYVSPPGVQVASDTGLRTAALLCDKLIFAWYGRFALRALYHMAVSRDFPEPLVGLQVTDYGADARVVTVTGEVDALTAPTLAACLSAQLAVPQVVVVDLDGVKFLASAGLQVLFEANELAIERGCYLRFVCNCPLANLVLETTGLRQHLTFADDVADALSNGL